MGAGSIERSHVQRAELPSPGLLRPFFEPTLSLAPETQLVQVELGGTLGSPATHLLVLPYGPSFPEAAWPDINHFLQRGGNLAVIGSQPFARAAVHGNRSVVEHEWLNCNSTFLRSGEAKLA